ncbi:MAG: PrsW family glutamic-type intramembrane protease [Candidatus Paceibacterota bacterium]
MIASIFFIGMVCVIIVIPLQKFIQNNVTSNVWQIIGWASIEELIKYLGVVILLYKTNRVDEPIDWPIFLITAALGFAALENTLYLTKSFSLDQATAGLLTGQLRYLGSTLLHAVSSGIIGISLGLSYYMGKYVKRMYLFMGIILAIALHSSFNFFIMENSGSNFLGVLGFLWVVTIIIMLLFEKLRRMGLSN